jgi:hypothetical protein
VRLEHVLELATLFCLETLRHTNTLTCFAFGVGPPLSTFTTESHKRWPMWPMPRTAISSILVPSPRVQRAYAKRGDFTVLEWSHNDTDH